MRRRSLAVFTVMTMMSMVLVVTMVPPWWRSIATCSPLWRSTITPSVATLLRSSTVLLMLGLVLLVVFLFLVVRFKHVGSDGSGNHSCCRPEEPAAHLVACESACSSSYECGSKALLAIGTVSSGWVLLTALRVVWCAALVVVLALLRIWRVGG